MEKRKSNIVFNMTITIILLVGLYIIVAMYFSNRFLPRTYINNINISFKTEEQVHLLLEEKCQGYKIEIKGRDNINEFINGSDIKLTYKRSSKINEIKNTQNSWQWLINLFNKSEYLIPDIYVYEKNDLEEIIKNFKYFNPESIIPPLSPCFHYNGEEYIIIDEIYGNKVNEEYLIAYLNNAISYAITEIDLEIIEAYEPPKFTSKDKEVIEAKKLLDKYVHSTIYYTIDDKIEIVDGKKINNWLDVDDVMNVIINENLINEFIKKLATTYDTYEITRNFKTTGGLEVVVEGGNYGWRINKTDEVQQLIEDIKSGNVVMREPIYDLRAMAPRKNDIGDTYVEINLTRQLLWFYVDGQVVTQGEIVTGNLSRGQGTPAGTYVLNYKQKDATLRGENYESGVQYWMPFNGNIGIHDASWRGSFGGEIYKNSGSHGCVNAPLYLAKTIYENIEPGTPIVCYTE